MDGSKVKLSCSLRWLSSVLPPSLLLEEVASERSNGATSPTVKQLLLSPFQRSILKQDVVHLLTSPRLYLCAHDMIVPGAQLERGNTFWPLIESLSKRGIYVVEEDETVVNHSALIQKDPFKQASHLALLDSLMTLYASTIVTVGRVVKTVKSISTFNASRELPSSVEDSLILWLNKVSESLRKVNKEESAALLMDSDPLQRRRSKMKLMNSPPEIPSIDQLGAGIADGQCLAALLLHYCQGDVHCSDFHFGGQWLTKQERLQNLNKAEAVYSSLLSPGSFHLSPGEILKWSQSSLLDSNIRALLAHLYYHFEVCKNGQDDKRSLSSLSEVAVNKSKSVTRQSSTTDFKIPLKSSLSMLQVAVPSRQPNLSSFSASTLEESKAHAQQSSTVFKPPLRSSLSASRVAILSQFERQSMNRLKGPHTQSSPAIHVSTTHPDVPKSSHGQQNDIITASTDNLMIREQMLTKKLLQRKAQRRVAGINPTESGSMVTPHQLSARPHPDVFSNFSDEEFHAQPSGVEVAQSEPLDKLRNGVTIDQLDAKPSKSVDVLRTSFTLDKQHTKLSASAAGIPIIEPQQTIECSTISADLPNNTVGNEEHLETEPNTKDIHSDNEETCPDAEENRLQTEKKCLDTEEAYSETEKKCQGSDEKCQTSSSCSPTSSMTQLVKFADTTHVDRSSYERELKPGSVLDLVLKKCDEAWATREKEAQLKLQLIRQDVYNSLVQERYDRESNCSDVSDNSRDDDSRAEEDSHHVGPETPVNATRVVRDTHSQSQRPSSPPSPPANTHALKAEALINKEQKVPPRPHSSTAKKLPLGRLQTLRELPLSPITNDESKPHGEVEMVSKNPWKTNNGSGLLHGTDTEEKLKERQAKLVKARIEGRDRDRKKAVEFRKKEEASKRAARGLPKSAGQNAGSPNSTPASTRASSPASSDSGESKFHNKTKVISKESPQHTWSEKFGQSETLIHEEEQRQRKEKLVKLRLDERERERKKALEFKRKKQAAKRTAHELLKSDANSIAGKRKSVTTSTAAVASSSSRRSSTVTAPPTEGDTLHFKLSSHDLHAATHQPEDRSERSACSSASTRPTTTTGTSASSRLTEYKGPDCYIKPQTKTNKNLIKNALRHVCLAGEANLSLKQRALAELESTSAVHIIILFRDIVGFKFRGLYSLCPDEDRITRIFGNGPKVIKASMTSQLYKYNCGTKEFQLIPSRCFSISVGAVTIKNQYWAKKPTHNQ